MHLFYAYYYIKTQYKMCYCNYPCSVLTKLNTIITLNSKLNSTIELLLCNIPDNSLDLQTIYATLAANNPMTVAAEYPSQEADKVVYSTTKVRFLDMLNPNIYVIFKGTFNIELPVYFKDTINYEHTITLGDINTPINANLLVNNYNYPALYISNYIILNPTEQTLEDFKNGLLN